MPVKCPDARQRDARYNPEVRELYNRPIAAGRAHGVAMPGFLSRDHRKRTHEAAPTSGAVRSGQCGRPPEPHPAKARAVMRMTGRFDVARSATSKAGRIATCDGTTGSGEENLSP